MEYSRPRNIRQRCAIIVILASGFLIGSLLTHNYTLAILSVLMAVILVIRSLQEPKEIVFAIGPHGIRIENKMYEFENLKSFWLFYDPPVLKELSIESKKMILPLIKIPLGDEDPIKIRGALTPYIPERKQEETFSDTLVRLIDM